jgi:ferredoxin
MGAEGFNSLEIYSILYRYDMVAVRWEIMAITIVFLLLVVVMSFTRGRLYCNSVCPVGTVLGFLSRFAIFKIELEKSSCTKCGKCARVCKAECIDIKSQDIDYSRCVACYNCIPVCPEDSMKYRTIQRSKEGNQKSGNNFKLDRFSGRDEKKLIPVPVVADLGKRNFITVLGLGAAALMGSGAAKKTLAQGHKCCGKHKGCDKSTATNANLLIEEKSYPVSPPGSESIERFNDICTGCSLCVTACPTKVLQPSILQYGLIGFMQPHMDFISGLCNFDCTVCGDVCPTGAIKPLTLEQKHVAQVGKAKFIKQNCVVETDGTDCGACSEHCPTKAVHMIPYGDVLLPEVTEELCVGCGACEFACPLAPGVKAIYIDGNPDHLVAVKPKTEKAKVNIEEDEFPF